MFQRIKAFLELIKFEHSIFALPFAYLGLFVAEGGLPKPQIFLWVTLAMVAIRTSGMCFNRLIDEQLDRKNPRTQGRIPLISLVTRARIWLVGLVSVLIFVFSAAQLNFLCLLLSPIPVLLVWIYPYLKRITWLSHFVLGIILSLAPSAGWLTSRGAWSLEPLVLALAVATWVSGFDMYYALQDIDFDKHMGLKSFPVRFGFERTMVTVRILHGITIVSLAAFGALRGMGPWYWAGWGAAALLIIWGHGLVRRFGLKKINEAFFNVNAWVSVVIFLAVALDLMVPK